MLTPAEEDRLEETLPSSVTVEHDGQQSEYHLTPFWSGPDREGGDASDTPDYPMLVFEWDVRGESADERQPVDNLHRVENLPDVPEYREVKTTEKYSDLVIQVAVNRQWDNSIPPDVRLTELSRVVKETCEQDLDDRAVLNEEGSDGERPMVVDVEDGVDTEPVDRTLRAQWTIRLHYRSEYEDVHETVDDVDYEVEQTQN